LNQPCQIINGLSKFKNQYSAFVVDAWGVLHDGQKLYPGVLDCFLQLSLRNLPVVILSNAARRHHHMIEELQLLGIDRNLYCDVVTSGELAWQSLYTETTRGKLCDKKGYYLGPERSRGLTEQLEVFWVDDINSADFILNTGTFEIETNLTPWYETLLNKAAASNLLMICANPDQFAIRNGELSLSAGALARRYEDLDGGVVWYFGKPYSAIYDRVSSVLNKEPDQKILAIGDAFETDIAGAKSAGLDCCLIANGIHRDDLLPLTIRKVLELGQTFGIPNYACDKLRW
jgi:HAD superfamily hydrolase (TIGR01459 family)